MLLKVLLLQLFGLICVSHAVAETPTTIKVLQGGTHRIDFVDIDNIRISRKGVIDVHMSDARDAVLITGLQKGMVMLTLQNAANITKRILVEVVSPRDEWTHAKRTHFSHNTEVLAKLLQQEVEVFEDADWLYVRAVCGMKSQRDQMQHVIDHQLSNAKLICRDQLQPKMFSVEAKILTIDARDLQELGLQADYTGVLSPKNLTLDHGLIAKIMAMEKSGKIATQGDPMIQCLEGQEVQVLSGGEFSTGEVQQNERIYTESWKSYGLQLKFKIQSTASADVVVEIDAALRSKDPEAPGRGLLSNQYITHVQLPLGKPAIIAGTELSSEGSQKSAIPGLSHWPIIGPLFAQALQYNSKVYAYLWFVVNLRNDAGVVTRTEFPMP